MLVNSHSRNNQIESNKIPKLDKLTTPFIQKQNYFLAKKESILFCPEGAAAGFFAEAAEAALPLLLVEEEEDEGVAEAVGLAALGGWGRSGSSSVTSSYTFSVTK